MIDRLDKKDSILFELQRALLHITDIQNWFNAINYESMFRTEVTYIIELLLDCS